MFFSWVLDLVVRWVLDLVVSSELLFLVFEALFGEVVCRRSKEEDNQFDLCCTLIFLRTFCIFCPSFVQAFIFLRYRCDTRLSVFIKKITAGAISSSDSSCLFFLNQTCGGMQQQVFIGWVRSIASTSCMDDRNLFPTYFLPFFISLILTLAWSNPCLLVAGTWLY
jgi:hypothetical protein